MHLSQLQLSLIRHTYLSLLAAPAITQNQPSLSSILPDDLPVEFNLDKPWPLSPTERAFMKMGVNPKKENIRTAHLTVESSLAPTSQSETWRRAVTHDSRIESEPDLHPLQFRGHTTQSRNALGRSQGIHTRHCRFISIICINWVLLTYLALTYGLPIAASGSGVAGTILF